MTSDGGNSIELPILGPRAQEQARLLVWYFVVFLLVISEGSEELMTKTNQVTFDEKTYCHTVASMVSSTETEQRIRPLVLFT